MRTKTKRYKALKNTKIIKITRTINNDDAIKKNAEKVSRVNSIRSLTVKRRTRIKSVIKIK